MLKIHWGYNEHFKFYRGRNLRDNLGAGKIIIASAVAGGLTLNPYVIEGLTAFSLGVQGYSSFKKFGKKAEKANFARVEYKNILDAIRFHLWVKTFVKEEFLEKVKLIDDFVSDHCMEIPGKIQVKYPKRFVAE